MGPLAHWLQAHLQASEAKVIPRAPVRCVCGGVHLRERDSARGWREEFLGFSSEGKTNALHSEEKGVQCRARSHTHSRGIFGNAMWDKEEACRVVLVT